ncbi:molybdopterin-dependent oxidoreductase [Luteimonas sp. SX5]|uniref:Molybdopterin-dependent oxidoreductase n=1 Tax=Luteimonas galliterrae TaxID=2940486 RepID=A0ABT0MKK2_9GAMM|nr:molybdopterin-dependent oxidoreductase [Luteimonas galliterrae]MCL1635407.1 molybdopterin-dependent oxidoreductase [Luteimonas galliterrae]
MTTRKYAMRTACLLLVAGLSACAAAGPVLRAAAPSHPEHAGRASEPMSPSPFVVPLDAATLAKLPREPVKASAHGQDLDCEGVALAGLLRATGAVPADPLRGPQLARYLLVTARDGYRAIYSLAELDPSLSDRRVLLVDHCSGKPLDDDDGPLRLIAPGDARPARWVRQVKSITVVAAP